MSRVTDRRCTISRCTATDYAADGMCMKHYQRNRRHGSPFVVYARGPAPADGRRRRVPAA